MSTHTRNILVCIDDTPATDESVQWLMNNIYKSGDHIHLVHVIHRFQLTKLHGDLAFHDQHSYQRTIQQSESFIAKRALKHIDPSLHASITVHILKYQTDTDSIGEILCKKAHDLHAVMMVTAHHREHEGRVHEVFVGSVSKYLLEHAPCAVVFYSYYGSAAAG